MQFFTALFTIFAIILSVNAAAILNKRAAPNVNVCIDNIQSVSKQLDVLGPSVNAGGIIDVNTDYNNFENAVSAAQSTCCAINTAISEVDSDETLAALGILTPKIQKVLSDIAVKVKDYNFVTMIFVHARLKSIEENSQKLNTCFSVFTPPSKASILAGYFKQIEDAIKTTKSA